MQGLTHDLSKFTPTEFIPSVKYFTGTRSPNEGERAAYGYSKAWLHHKGRNKHHFEYWFDYNMSKHRVEPVRMPERFVVEMFCDRVAASKTYRGKEYSEDYPLFYFLKGKANRVIDRRTSDELEALLTMLRDDGEDRTAAYIKAKVKGHSKYDVFDLI